MTRHTWSLDGASEELAVDFETNLFLSVTSSSIVLSMVGLLRKMKKQALLVSVAYIINISAASMFRYGVRQVATYTSFN